MPFDDTMFLKRHVDILSFFTDDQLRRVTAEIDRQTYNKGQTVVFQGEISHNFHIIKRGKMQVFSKSGGDRALVAELGPGDFFGEMSLLDSTTASATIRAAEDGSEILMISHDTFKQLLREFPALELALRDKVAERQRQRHAALQAKKPGDAPAGGGSPL
ncbi:MAG TPA: cyclic nucleotide-binding domain-containing protein [Elusimicrobiota bacterium]|nr:cyclic nucleotide-binding domain-containing protein [Elusimicrobiota bacterium]HNI56107.1 cyclic nucleotide-binding domain-containing protein [Elusimicrobiota bacterium]